jgi:hypothetical protein
MPTTRIRGSCLETGHHRRSLTASRNHHADPDVPALRRAAAGKIADSLGFSGQISRVFAAEFIRAAIPEQDHP